MKKRQRLDCAEQVDGTCVSKERLQETGSETELIRSSETVRQNKQDKWQSQGQCDTN